MRIFVCLLAAMMLAWPAAANAQRVSGGLKGGLASTNLSVTGPGAFDTSADVTGAAGGFAAVELGRMVRLQAELLLTALRASVPAPGVTVKARAVAVPVLLHLRFGERRVRPVIFAGPQFSAVSNVTQTSAAGEADISDDIRDIDLSVAIGAGLEAEAGRGAFLLEVRGAVGVRDLSETGPPAIKSRAWLLLAGYRF